MTRSGAFYFIHFLVLSQLSYYGREFVFAEENRAHDFTHSAAQLRHFIQTLEFYFHITSKHERNQSYRNVVRRYSRMANHDNIGRSSAECLYRFPLTVRRIRDEFELRAFLLHQKTAPWVAAKSQPNWLCPARQPECPELDDWHDRTSFVSWPSVGLSGRWNKLTALYRSKAKMHRQFGYLACGDPLNNETRDGTGTSIIRSAGPSASDRIIRWCRTLFVARVLLNDSIHLAHWPLLFDGHLRWRADCQFKSSGPDQTSACSKLTGGWSNSHLTPFITRKKLEIRSMSSSGRRQVQETPKKVASGKRQRPKAERSVRFRRWNWFPSDRTTHILLFPHHKSISVSRYFHLAST